MEQEWVGISLNVWNLEQESQICILEMVQLLNNHIIILRGVASDLFTYIVWKEAD